MDQNEALGPVITKMVLEVTRRHATPYWGGWLFQPYLGLFGGLKMFKPRKINIKMKLYIPWSRKNRSPRSHDQDGVGVFVGSAQVKANFLKVELETWKFQVICNLG